MQFNKKNIVTALVIMTIVKTVIIYVFFQHIVVYDGKTAHIARAYAWGELVENMHQGEYVNTSQYSLENLYDFKFHAMRPPLYAFWLYFVSLFGKYAGFVAILGQSIVTSLVAWMGFKIVSLQSRNKWIPAISLFVLFFLPMNFVKSGTLDDATFMLLFLLTGINYLTFSSSVSKSYKKYINVGLFFGLALLTRPAALFPIAGIIFYILLSRKIQFKNLMMLVVTILLVLSPWIIRNSVVIGKPVLTNGSARILLLIQSNEFINNYPEKSIDEIDKLFFSKYHEKFDYINKLEEKNKDNEFLNLAREQLIKNPMNFLQSILVKTKVFIPDRYYPHRPGFWKNAIYITQYAFALIVFIIALMIFLFKHKRPMASKLILASLLSYTFIVVPLFLLSRHFYPLIVLMILFSGVLLTTIQNKQYKYWE